MYIFCCVLHFIQLMYCKSVAKCAVRLCLECGESKMSLCGNACYISLKCQLGLHNTSSLPFILTRDCSIWYQSQCDSHQVALGQTTTAPSIVLSDQNGCCGWWRCVLKSQLCGSLVLLQLDCSTLHLNFHSMHL